jgi:DNA-binding ferritin-like protein (Dps family)
MKIIKILSEKIEEEVCDAKAYVKMAIEYKEEYPELSRDLYNLSMQEMDHMQILHNDVTELIRRYRETNGEPPADMMAVYDYLHKKQIDKALEVKTLQTMYKES